MNREFLTSFMNPSLESDISYAEGSVEQDAIIAEHAALGIECAHTEIESVERSMDDLHDVAVSLEELAFAAEASIPEGGLDRQAAALLACGVQAQTKRLGVDGLVASMESFGGASGRVSATTVSMEGIKEFADKIWKAIVSAFESMKKAVREFWLKYFDSIPRMMKAAQKMKDKIGELSGDPEEKKISISNLKQLHIQGRFPTDFKAQVTAVKDLAVRNKDTKGSREMAEKYAEMVVDLNFDDEKKFLDTADKLLLELNKISDKYRKTPNPLAALTGDRLKRFGADVVVSGSAELLGGKMIYFQVGKEVEKRNKAGSGVKNRLAKWGKCKSGITAFAEKEKDIDSDAEITTLTLSEMGDILDDVITACGVIMDYKKNQPTDDKAADKAKDASGKFLKQVGKAEEGNSLQPYVNQVSSLSSKLGAMATNFPTEVGKYLGTTLSAIMSVVSKSASQYKKA